jgi:2-polyprenyl-3-methyl-5-hydroxy-6-metoxy-1,4-benzoquinol methylase
MWSVRDMSRLTDEHYWNKVWKGTKPGSSQARLVEKIKDPVKRAFGERRKYFTRSYADYQICEGIYRLHLPTNQAATILEIGSAPGNYLLDLHHEFGLTPYGVDYSDVGVTANRELFARNGIETANVIEADAFANTFQDQYFQCFDVVISRGVIEHFTGAELDYVIRAHVNLVKPGGRLIITIPNYRGLNYLVKLLFCRYNLSAHNFSIMRQTEFAKLFEGRRLNTLFCGYAGTLDISMSVPSPHSRLRARVFYQLFDKSQVLLNGLLRLILRKKGADNSWISPYLLFIGKMTAVTSREKYDSTDTTQ